MNLRVVALTVLAMAAFAANSLLCRMALAGTTIDAASFTAIRIACGAAMLAVILRSQGKRPMAGGSWPAAAMLFAYAAGFSFAYRELTAATGALLLFGAVQMTMLGYGFLRGERLGLLPSIGLLAALAGLGVLLIPGFETPSLTAGGCMVSAGLAWGVYSLLGKGARNPTEATAGNFLRAVPFAAVLGLATMGTANVDRTGALYAAISGAVTSGLGYVLWYAVLPRLKATSAATIQLSVPIIATLGGALLLAEPITGRLLIASVAIIGGIALVIGSKR